MELQKQTNEALTLNSFKYMVLYTRGRMLLQMKPYGSILPKNRRKENAPTSFSNVVRSEV